MKRAITHIAIACAALVAAGCTDNTIVDLPEEENNSIVIAGKEYTATRLVCDPVDITYKPDGEAAEEGLSIRIMAEGASIAIDIPVRLAGSRIDLMTRNLNPRPGEGTYFSFIVSARATPEELAQEPPVNPPGVFYRILSWGSKEEQDTGVIPYGGYLTVTRGEAEGEWIVEWEITDRVAQTTVSTGYVKNIFE